MSQLKRPAAEDHIVSAMSDASDDDAAMLGMTVYPIYHCIR